MASAATYAPSGSSYYVWWFPGSPVRVHLSLDVVRRLGEQLQTTPAQGFLFGKTADGATEILDFQSSPAPAAEPRRNARRVRPVFPALLCTFAILVALVAVGSRWWAERGMAGSTAARTGARPAQPLSVLVMGLRAKRQNGDVEITWNHDSPVVA